MNDNARLRERVHVLMDGIAQLETTIKKQEQIYALETKDHIRALKIERDKVDDLIEEIASLQYAAIQKEAKLSRYEQAVRVEDIVYAVAPNGHDVVGKIGIHVPESFIGQRVTVIVLKGD